MRLDKCSSARHLIKMQWIVGVVIMSIGMRSDSDDEVIVGQVSVGKMDK